MYLGLEVSASHIHARFPAHATLLQSRGHIRYGYGTFTLFGCAVPGNFTFSDLDKRLQTTSPSLSSWDSACPIPFSFATTHGISVDFISSPYSDASIRGVPYRIAIVSEETGSPIQLSADPRHSCVSPQLVAACHDLHRHSSRAIPQLGCSITCMYSTPCE